MTEQSQAADTNNDNQDAPKERQLHPDQLTEWGDALELTLPESKTEGGKTLRGSSDVLAEAQAGNNGEGEDKDKADKKDDKDVVVDDDTDDVEVEPVVTLEDPGDYTPADYSFTVTVYSGEEGKEKPKTIKITSVEQAEQLLEEDPNFGSAKNLLDFNRKLARMESSLERDENEHKKKKAEYEAQVGQQAERTAYVESVTKGISYLVSKGKLPKVAPELMTANWADPEVQKQPGVKEQIELLNYITKENKARDKAGIPRITATEAFTEMQLESKSNESQEAKRKAEEARKAAGARVAGSSPAPITGNAPKGIAVGRVSGAGLRGLGANQW